MALDGILLRKISLQLDEACPMRINRIYDISDTELLFNVKTLREKQNLLVSCHSNHNRIQFSSQHFETFDEPSNFVMLLRKHLQDSAIVSIKQIHLDRLLEIGCVKRDALGDQHNYRLMIELMGKYANCILVDENGVIMDALKRIPPFEMQRIIQKGAIYQYPERQERKDPFVETYHPEHSLSEQFEGFSPFLAKQIQERIDRHEDFKAIMSEIETSNNLFIDPNGRFHLFKFNEDCVSYPLFEGLDMVYQSLEEKERIKKHTGDVLKFVKRELKKTESKRPKLLEALDAAHDNEKWKNYADHLMVYGLNIQKGTSEITVDDFETGNPLVIPLDPQYDGKQNARRYYQRYQKGRNGQIHIQRQLDLNAQEQAYFSQLLYQLEHASIQEAKDIKDELIHGRYLRQKASPRKGNKKKQEQVYRIILDDSTSLLFGKNNLQNENITFKLAHRDDLWFHVQDYHGSHVVLQGPAPKKEWIELAAMFALYFSEARSQAKANVQMTPIKNVKKIPDSKPGMVRLSSYESLSIQIDEQMLEPYLKQVPTHVLL